MIFLNKFINKNLQLSQQTKPLAMYHMKIFEACKYSQVEDPIHREGKLSLTQIWFEHNASQYSCFASKSDTHQIAELLFLTTFFVHRNCCRSFQRRLSQFFLSQTWNLLLPPSWCKQFCQSCVRTFSCSKSKSNSKCSYRPLQLQ